MQMPAKFHEIPSMGLQDIKESTLLTDGRTDGRENSIPPLKLRFGGGYKYNHATKPIRLIYYMYMCGWFD